MRPLLLSALIISLFPKMLIAEEQHWQHAMSLVSPPSYQQEFSHFNYVNIKAPKGGIVRFATTGTFDSFNLILAKGTQPSGLTLLYDTLMKPSLDEVSAEYGLIAEAVSYPDDFSSATFRLNPKARWHDGKPITPQDVIWSFEVQKENNPQSSFYYRHVVKAEQSGKHEVTFTFDQTDNHELPYIVGQLTILPKHYWTTTDKDGKLRDITKTTLEPPLGSGPYKIKKFTPGRSITYERVADYWAHDLNVNIGYNNFEEIQYEFFRDNAIALEAFKSDKYDWRIKVTAKGWVTGYDFSAVNDGHVVKETFANPYRRAGVMKGFIFNLRRPIFQDPRVRQALNYAFNFEKMNRAIFFGLYERPNSYFYGIPLASSALPKDQELDILEVMRDNIPAEVFTKEYKPPINDTPQAMRANLRKAYELLKAAGYQRKGNRLIHKKNGKPLQIEYLLQSPAFERVALQLKENLKRLGIKVTIRSVDSSQYVNRVRSSDFDIIYTGWAQSMSPGNELLEYFGSKAANRLGSKNYGGIQNEAIDALINKVIFAKDRAEQIAATKALDRVLLWNHYIIPGWTSKKVRTARWDRFSHPEPLPKYAIGFPSIWWYDKKRAAKIEDAQ